MERKGKSPSKPISNYIAKTKSNNVILNLLSKQTLFNYARNLNIKNSVGNKIQLRLKTSKEGISELVTEVINGINQRQSTNIFNKMSLDSDPPINFVECLNVKHIKKDEISKFDNFNFSYNFNKTAHPWSNTRNKHVGVATENKLSDSNNLDLNIKDFSDIAEKQRQEDALSIVKNIMENKIIQQISEETSRKALDSKKFNNQFKFDHYETETKDLDIMEINNQINLNIPTIQSLKTIKSTNAINLRGYSENVLTDNKNLKLVLINKNNLVQKRKNQIPLIQLIPHMNHLKNRNNPPFLTFNKYSNKFEKKFKSVDFQNQINAYTPYKPSTYLTDVTDTIENPLLKKENIHKEFKKLKTELRKNSTKVKTIVDELKRTQNNNDEYLRSYGSILKVSKLKTQNRDRLLPSYN